MRVTLKELTMLTSIVPRAASGLKGVKTVSYDGNHSVLSSSGTFVTAPNNAELVFSKVLGLDLKQP